MSIKLGFHQGKITIPKSQSTKYQIQKEIIKSKMSKFSIFLSTLVISCHFVEILGQSPPVLACGSPGFPGSPQWTTYFSCLNSYMSSVNAFCAQFGVTGPNGVCNYPGTNTVTVNDRPISITNGANGGSLSIGRASVSNVANGGITFGGNGANPGFVSAFGPGLIDMLNVANGGFNFGGNGANGGIVAAGGPGPIAIANAANGGFNFGGSGSNGGVVAVNGQGPIAVGGANGGFNYGGNGGNGGSIAISG